MICKTKLPILKTVEGLIRTKGVPFWQPPAHLPFSLFQLFTLKTKGGFFHTIGVP